ncbi:MAG: hypothetical protein JXR48_17340 [Candidatus Delongbacteria bacterium]|nr:hypothetical protein [Candidatus Delongbacteria bacterium]MBN2836724.1 hypothetical protein [Candidatus Delongbacteria bacterium]
MKYDFDIFKGWNNWHSPDALTFVHKESGFGISLKFKHHNWIEEVDLNYALFGNHVIDEGMLKPVYHSLDGSYSEMKLEWRGMSIAIKSAKIDEDILISVSLLEKNIGNPLRLIVKPILLWNRKGTFINNENIEFKSEVENFTLYNLFEHEEDYFVNSDTPYRTAILKDELIVTTKSDLTASQAKIIIDSGRNNFLSKRTIDGKIDDNFIATEAVIGFNTIYDPKDDRIISTVGRLWNREYGGYCLFGWDNFFLSFISLLFDEKFAKHNAYEHLKGVTHEGFIANDHRGNGTWSWDRSQPIVGSMMIWAIFVNTNDINFLKNCFPYLEKWNRWYFENRMNDGLLSYGSHKSTNMYNEPHTGTLKTAKYESGMDDSPMYTDVPFNSEKNTMELNDVGLNSLFLRDCELLLKISELLNIEPKLIEEIRIRYDYIKTNFSKLWSEESSSYLNYRTDLKSHYNRVSPTIFYPLFTDIPSDENRKSVVENYLINTKFKLEYPLPSVPKDDPDYDRQRYWKGAIWPPLNFLAYYGLKYSEFNDEAKWLAHSSASIYLNNWRKKNYVCENYCSIDGSGDSEKLSSDVFHSWGALMGIMNYIEGGKLKLF